MRKKTNDEFRIEFREKVGFEYDYDGIYIDKTTPLLMRHNSKRCNYNTFPLSPEKFLYKGQRCPICSKLDKKKENEEKVLRKLEKEGNGEYLFEGEYKGVKEHLMVTHLVCGHKYPCTPNNFFLGYRCSRCAHRMPKEEALKNLNDAANGEYIFDEDKYVDSKTHIPVTHLICGHKYPILPHNFLNGDRCPECKRRRRMKTTEQFKKDLFNKYGKEFTCLGKYKGCGEKILVRHNICGHKSRIEPERILWKWECQHCKKRVYKGEEKVYNYLISNDIPFYREYSFKDCKDNVALRFDFAVFDKKENLLCLIEYDGIQHFEPHSFHKCSMEKALFEFEQRKRRDKIKNDYCTLNNYPLLRIKYTEFDSIDEIIERSLSGTRRRRL